MNTNDKSIYNDELVEGIIRDSEMYTRRRNSVHRVHVGGRNSSAILESFSNINPKPVEWLWPGRIALGKLTLIAGDPGLGKSLVSAALSASVSRGCKWPVDGTQAPVGDILLLSAEDDAADTIRPRLDAAGADCSRVNILRAIQDGDTQRIFSLKLDISALAAANDSLPTCKLVIIDPISAYLDGTDSHNNSDVRGLLAPLAEYARRYKVAVVLIHHLNKNSGGNALYRTIGSIAFTAAVRTAYLVAKDKTDPARRLFLPTKNNLAKEGSGLAYSVKSDHKGSPVLVWETEPVNISASEALSVAQSQSDSADDNWTMAVVRDILSEGPVHAAEASSQAKKSGPFRKTNPPS